MLVRKVMLMDDFKTWLEMRPVGPTSQMVFVDEAASGEEHYLDDASLITGDGLLDVHIDRNALDMEDPRLKKIRCLGTKFRQLRLHQHSPVTVHIPFPEGQKPLPDGNMLVKSLIRPEVGRTAFRSHVTLPDSVNDLASKVSEPEVLIVYWDIRHFPFSLGTDTLDYSSKIHKLTQRLVDPYRPYLTVHWRMETIPPFMLPDCAEALVDTLNTLLSDPTLGADIKTVWFASDFPWPVSASAASVSNDALFGSEEDDTQNYMQIASSARRSNTFRSVSHEHVEAIEIVKAAFRGGGTLEGWRLTGVTEELDRVRRDMEKEGKLYVLEEDDEEGRLLDDSGVLGILDKMAAMQAALFVSGAKRCGRVSTFTKQITESRANVWGSNVHRNVVEVFG